jgi:hypothetical protein
MKAIYQTINLLIILLLCFSYSCKGQFTKLNNQTSLSNIEFEKLKYKIVKKDTVEITGYLKNETQIGEYFCAADLVHFTKELKLVYFKLGKAFKLDKAEIPKGAWVSLERAGYYICNLPSDETIQGFACLGGNEHKGPTVTFDNEGNLHAFYSPSDIKIGQIYCAGGKSNKIGLLKNGSLAFCTLSIDHNINEVKYKQGQILSFDFNGNVASVKEK